MTCSFHPEAESEFISAIEYYEVRQENLGLDFSLEVQKAIQTIVSDPTEWTKMSDKIRRRLLNRFPFGILYHFDKKKDHIFIIAIMHLNKEPNYWKKRI